MARFQAALKTRPAVFVSLLQTLSYERWNTGKCSHSHWQWRDCP
jgi:hypothetical protein